MKKVYFVAGDTMMAVIKNHASAIRTALWAAGTATGISIALTWHVSKLADKLKKSDETLELLNLRLITAEARVKLLEIRSQGIDDTEDTEEE